MTIEECGVLMRYLDIKRRGQLDLRGWIDLMKPKSMASYD